MMTTEWKDLPTLQDVACAQADGWEIEARISARPNDKFEQWSGVWWEASYAFRGRPRQPKMKKVKQVCFFSASGLRYDMLENGEQHRSIGHSIGWIRAPSEDKEIEVPE